MRRQARVPRIPHIDFEARQRQVNDLIAERQRYAASFVKMPGAEEINSKVGAHAEKLHPVKQAFTPAGKPGSKVSWNPINFSQTWYYHPLRTLNHLLPVNVGMGIGRKSKKRQVDAYKKDFEKKSQAFANMEGAKKMQIALQEYIKRLNNALAELKATSHAAEFERKIDDAEKFFRRETARITTDYASRTGREKIKKL